MDQIWSFASLRIYFTAFYSCPLAFLKSPPLGSDETGVCPPGAWLSSLAPLGALPKRGLALLPTPSLALLAVGRIRGC